MVMSSMSDVDVATLHNDCNISHTISLYNVKPFLNDLERFLRNTRNCLCTLREIVLHSHLDNIDITNSSNEDQLHFFIRLASERFNSKCFTDSNSTICIRIFLTSPDLEVNISNWNVEQLKEYASRFMNEASQIPVDVKLHLACLAKDHECVKEVLNETHTTDLKKKDMLFYGISCGEIVDALVQSGADVNTKDARGRTPLFYALTSSLDSAKKLLDKGARVTARDGCRVSVLTFFAENMLKNHLPADVKAEGIKLLSERMNRAQMIKEVMNLMLCKFIQVLGTRQQASNPQNDYLSSNMLCEPLELVLSHTNDGRRADDRNNLISQLQSIQDRIAADNFAVSDVLQSFDTLGADPLAPDSEGNTSLHYATQLLFYGVPKETVIDICNKLMHMKRDARLDVKNHKKETPLLFCLSSKHLIASTEASNWSGCLRKVCEVLMEKGSELSHTNHKEESAFQLIFKVCQYAILLQDEHQKLCIFEEMFEILSKFSVTEEVQVAVNKRDKHLNSPLHLWASLALKPSSLYSENLCSDYSFEVFMSKILDMLVNKCDIQRDDTNKKGQKPLHLCRTWTAVKLLIDYGAEPDVKDSSGCTPLLAATKRNTCIKKESKRFYPDVTQTPNEFWKEVLNRELDPWTSDKNGDSVLSILIEKEANLLAKALIEVACELKCVQSDAIAMSLLVTICRDQSTEKDWKVDLAKTLLVCRKSLAQRRSSDKDTALHCFCMLGLPEESVKTSVHWKIAQYLLLGGADMKAAGKPEDSCLRLLQSCPVVRKLLSTEDDPSKLPIVLENWKPSSKRHAPQLSMVARMVKCRHVGGLNFYEKALEKKSPGDFVFAGIVQIDGREVAVKRIDKSKMSHKNGLENVLVLSTRCEHIVQYLLSEKQGNFHYFAFELMEGDLEHYLDKATGAKVSTKLCKELLLGLQFLQSQDTPVVHGNINPRTVFYQSEPNVCLKIGNCKTSSLRIGWIAPEVLKGETSFSNQSDIFSCGLVLHYLLSGRKHPFAPADSATKSPEEALNETDNNISNGNIVRIDDSLSPEAAHLVRLMLDSDPSNRPSAGDALVHPFFWDNETKKKFLRVVGNEPEIAMQVRHPLTAFESEVEGRFNAIVTRGTTWNDSPPYDNMSDTYAEMRIRRDYDYETVAGLIRFIRNTYEHINEQPERIQKMWEDDFVLNDYFPHLVIEVYQALTTSKIHQLHKSRKGIKKFFSELK